MKTMSPKPGSREKPMTFSFVDLFAGIGGMRLAFAAAGGHCVFSSEWDQHAQKTYAANFGEVPRGDVTKIQSSEIPKFDVLCAGFPCQPFSSIGKRQGFGHPTQGTLFHEIVRILGDHDECRAVLLENVAGLITHDSGKTLSVIENSLTDLGFSFDYRVLDAYDFGSTSWARVQRDLTQSDVTRWIGICLGVNTSTLVPSWSQTFTAMRFPNIYRMSICLNMTMVVLRSYIEALRGL